MATSYKRPIRPNVYVAQIWNSVFQEYFESSCQKVAILLHIFGSVVITFADCALLPSAIVKQQADNPDESDDTKVKTCLQLHVQLLQMLPLLLPKFLQKHPWQQSSNIVSRRMCKLTNT